MSTFLCGQISKIMEREPITWKMSVEWKLLVHYTRILKSISLKCSLSCCVPMYLSGYAKKFLC